MFKEGAHMRYMVHQQILTCFSYAEDSMKQEWKRHKLTFGPPPQQSL